MAALSLRATRFFEPADKFVISDELVGRLYRSSEQAILEIAAGMSPRDRASLAVFCYGKAHLHEIGLTIASTCELATLVQVMGNACGQIIFDQSHARKAAVEQATLTRRPDKVTLPTCRRKAPPASPSARGRRPLSCLANH
jgi:short-subunit dehydrogenase involved in D-alanine esterification of teichoic acids